MYSFILLHISDYPINLYLKTLPSPPEHKTRSSTEVICSTVRIQPTNYKRWSRLQWPISQVFLYSN